MAGKPKAMSQIKQVLRMYQKGGKIKTMARELGISKNTIKSYLQRVELNNWPVEVLLRMDDPELEKKLLSGNPAYKDTRYEKLKPKLAYYADELRRTGVTKLLLFEEYHKEHPDGYSRSQFCYHLLQFVRARKPSMVLNHKPGDKLFIDFAGKKLSFIDRHSGEIMECQVFVACLPFSDFGFAMAVPSQRIHDFIHALQCCLISLGGVPGLIVPDNLKSAIVQANKYEPKINRALEDFANHYNTSVLPARVRKPKDKALVENQVKLIYNRIYAPLRNRQFFSLQELNQAIKEYMHKHNQTRMQEKPWCREERFLAEEKPRLAPLTPEPFEIKSYREYTVRLNNHVQLSEDKHYYSVPYSYIGKTVKVIYTRSIVRIYHQGELIAAHVRSYSRGFYTTNRQHLCSHHKHYGSRSPDYYREKARSISAVLYTLIDRVFHQNRHPEQLYGTCDGLLNIYRKMDPEKADKACAMALEYENYSYRFILNILKNNTMEELPIHQQKPLPDHKNVRGADYYKNNFK